MRNHQKEILKEKFLLIKFAYDNLNSSKKKYGKRTKRGTRILNGIELAKQNQEIQFYSESFFFQVKSFLDIFMKFLLNKKYFFQYNKNRKKKRNIYFNYWFLKDITPKKNYITSLINYWNNGLTKKKYSLKVFNKYRNFICHENSISWASGQVNESNKFKWYILPDSLNSKKFVYHKNINLFELCDETYLILNEILKNCDTQTKYKLKK